MSGGVAIIDDEKVLKRTNLEVRKTRRKRKRLEEKLRAENGGELPEGVSLVNVKEGGDAGK